MEIALEMETGKVAPSGLFCAVKEATLQVAMSFLATCQGMEQGRTIQ